jgi:hypothetical protein
MTIVPTAMIKHRVMRAALLPAAALLMLAGCGTNDPSTEASSTPSPSASPLDYDGPTPSAPTSTPYITPSASLPPATAVPSEPPGTPGKAGTPRGLPATALRPDRTDPTAVAAAFSILLMTYDTRLDNQPADAGRRAATLASAKLANELRQPPPGGGNGVAWTELQQHDGYTKATASDATEAGAPVDRADQATRAVRISSTPIGEGWTGQPDVRIVYLRLTHGGGTWVVQSYDVQ